MSRELEIIHRICDFNFSEDWDSKTKTQSKVFERAIYYKLSKEFTKSSLSEIGRRINKDHATVLHGLKIFKKDIKQSKQFSSYKKLYENLKQKCELRLLKKEFKQMTLKQKIMHSNINLREENLRLKETIKTLIK